ncbi:MAG: UDP-N-acetylglucosamine 2-epimerase (hydrolyzing) [Flavobacterium sp.]|uniref:UDP-N-acetylglucosamine 2-epimerase n=1 Tax=Flavobacterium sp. TaxID=239 RepID=UPI00120A120E|nr:UDP-N-acetylglucosamine 2-epimerase [Flavobacterium sp.]RZJ66085.1 MAG: UDP-N-acetylglucosamine 2-epimerase (hydrolyzing) [Flavobacterium sp.]
MKKILFLTGTRADFGKIKSLIEALEAQDGFEVFVFVTGMHLQHEYGYTLIEIERCGFKNLHTFSNHTHETTMDLTLAKTIEGFSAYAKTIHPDLIVVHGDRVETLAGAITGSLNNILVAHIEGGELSGTVDELIRHSVTKLSHIHFVSNDDAARRLVQMGETKSSVYTIGSPDVDIMFSPNLPKLPEVKDHYDIAFDQYAIAMFHPVTTEAGEMQKYAHDFAKALLEDSHNYIVIYPNNDLGSRYILDAYAGFEHNERFRVFPSLRFEYFLVLLHNARFIIGNSSAGIREAPYYGIPVINVGTRQQNRALHADIVNVGYAADEVSRALSSIDSHKVKNAADDFGKGDSTKLFIDSLSEPDFWKINQQKQFRDS